MGRFISEDPVPDPNNPNLYVYCRNNPLILVDPAGTRQKGFINDAFGGNDEPEKETPSPSPTETVNPSPGGSPSSPSPSTGNPPSTPTVSGMSSMTITISDKNTEVVETIDVYTNKRGDNITITTRTVGNTIEQSYKIKSADGSVVREEKIDYVSGVPGQRNVIAVEGFVSEAKYSRAIMIVVGREGAVDAWQGSTLPSDPSKYPTIAETEIGKPLEMTKGMHYGSNQDGYEAIILNQNKAVSTTGDNPNEKSDYAGQKFANYIALTQIPIQVQEVVKPSGLLMTAVSIKLLAAWVGILFMTLSVARGQSKANF